MTRPRMLTAFLLVFGIATLCVGWSLRHASTRGNDWPSTTAKILDRHMENAGKVQLFYPVVKYSYTIGGKAYTNDRVYAAGRIDSRAPTVQKLLDELPDPVPIFYDPDDPQDSYILRTSAWMHWILFALGGITTLVGLARIGGMFTRGT
jgi:hypothetical protein